MGLLTVSNLVSFEVSRVKTIVDQPAFKRPLAICVSNITGYDHCLEVGVVQASERLVRY